MQNKPSVKSLIIQSHKFVMANTDLIRQFAMPLFVPLAILTIISNVGGYYSEWATAVEFISIYFIACFTLAWHRAFLLGPKLEYAVNPAALKPGEGKFIAVVYALSLAPLVIGFFVGVLAAIGKTLPNPVVLPIIAVVCFILFIIGMLTILRWCFILPAKSVNADISLKEASRLSKGLLFPLILSGAVFALLLFLVIVIPIIIATMVIGIFFTVKTLPFVVAVCLLIQVPCIAVMLYAIAVNVGMLSRLYQWSVQERG